MRAPSPAFRTNCKWRVQRSKRCVYSSTVSHLQCLSWVLETQRNGMFSCSVSLVVCKGARACVRVCVRACVRASIERTFRVVLLRSMFGTLLRVLCSRRL